MFYLAIVLGCWCVGSFTIYCLYSGISPLKVISYWFWGDIR